MAPLGVFDLFKVCVAALMALQRIGSARVALDPTTAARKKRSRLWPSGDKHYKTQRRHQNTHSHRHTAATASTTRSALMRQGRRRAGPGEQDADQIK